MEPIFLAFIPGGYELKFLFFVVLLLIVYWFFERKNEYI